MTSCSRLYPRIPAPVDPDQVRWVAGQLWVALAQALAELFLARGWVERTSHRRGLAVSPEGVMALGEH